MTESEGKTILAYIGTYTRSMPHVQARAEGIYLYRFDATSGALEQVGVARNVDNPSYLTIRPDQTYLYAANEVGDFGGQSSGAVSAFSIDPQSGALTFINQQPTGGAAPCYVTVDASGQYVLSANYTGGSVCVHPVQADGSLGEATDFIQHEGSSVNPRRQEGPHAHSINLSPDNRFAFAADLGMDKLLIYKLEGGKLTPNSQPWVAAQPGVGPRHFDFHPSGQYAYLINEIGNTVVAYAYDEADGRLEELQTIATLPPDFEGRSHTADIHVHPSGKFVYGSNRGHDSIVIYAIDQATGKLTLAGHESTQGKVPRNFTIDPTGNFLLAANQNTDNIATYHIDPDSGKLTPTGHIVEAPTPVCIKMMVVS
jgi:6-phosphogluconolactonase